MNNRIILMTALAMAGAPAAASAKTCVDVFEQCLNDTYDTSGLTRILANAECAARYAGCVRQTIF